MKNVKLLGLLGLSSMLFLTGCGGDAHTLTCSKTEDDGKVEVKVKFNSDETKAEKVTMDMTMKGDDASKEELEQAKALYEGFLCANKGEDGFDKCEVSVKGNDLVIHMEGTAESLGEEDFDGSMEEVKKAAEEDGYTCK